MDRSTRCLDASQGQTPSASENFLPLDTVIEVSLGAYPITVRNPRWCVRADNFPLGEGQRNSSSPFPPETGKRTLETGPSYER